MEVLEKESAPADSAEEGGEFLEDHPILRDAAILPTKPMEEFINILLLWLDNLLPGGLIWGYQRMGKTQAVRCVIANSEQLLGCPIPTTLLSAWDPTHTTLTENRFFGELLQALGYALPSGGTAAIKRRRTIDFMASQAIEAKEHRYLLFVDEAQWLANVQLRYLMDLHNQLKLADVRLITVLVGQPELLRKKKDLRSAKQNHLLGRFMTATHQYKGISDKTDFRRILRSLDLSSEYPKGSGCSFTRYFAPAAFDAGWRLEQQTELIWGTLETTLRQEKIQPLKEIPMQAAVALIRWLLRRIEELDSPELTINRNQVEEAIYRVALLQLEDHAAQEASVKLGRAAGGR